MPPFRPNPNDSKIVVSDGVETWQDNETHITRYSDGSSTVYWGGPSGGVQDYDENGEEC